MQKQGNSLENEKAYFQEKSLLNYPPPLELSVIHHQSFD